MSEFCCWQLDLYCAVLVSLWREFNWSSRAELVLFCSQFLTSAVWFLCFSPSSLDQLSTHKKTLNKLECFISVMSVVLCNIHELKMIKKRHGGIAEKGDFKVLSVLLFYTAL